MKNEKIVLESKLLDLMLDSESFGKLSEWTSTLNVFDILKISKTEIRHSNMLAWLLDPNETHGIGDVFLRGVLSHLAKSIEVETAVKMLAGDLSSFRVFRELSHIDLLLVSRELAIVVAIENKIGAGEHYASGTMEKQTIVYKERVQTQYKGYNQIFVFLTPEGEEPSDEEWLVMTYSDILGILKPIAQMAGLKPEVELLLKNYIETIKRNVIMDPKLVELCNEIYMKHKEALDLIYENKYDLNSQISSLCKDILRVYQNQGIEYDETSTKTYVRFRTQKLNSYFQGILPKESYYYQFEIRNPIKVMLEFYKDGDVNEDVIEKTNSYACNFKKNYKKICTDNWKKWKRAWTIPKNIDDYDEEDIKKWMMTQIDHILRVEESIEKK